MGLPTGANTLEPDDLRGGSTHSLPGLTADVIRACFGSLDWRTLGRCSCVCRSWNVWASDPNIWYQQLRRHYHRPGLLQHTSLLTQQKPLLDIGPYLRQLPDGRELVAAAAAIIGRISSLAVRDAAIDSGASSTASQQERLINLNATTPKQLFAQCLADPAASHQALLACFQSAMSKITAWRVVISHGPTQWQHPLLGADDITEGDSSCSKQAYTGHPEPLSMDVLESGACWCIGCVQVQQQEQSCWLRFKMPSELQTDPALHQEAQKGYLTATVQALGPADVGWFDVASSSPFEVKEDDFQILKESHRSGFYTWILDEAEEADPTDGLELLPWDIAPAEAGDDVAQGGSHAGEQHQGRQPQVPQGAQQVVQEDAANTDTLQVAEYRPRVRMVVYIHYEQLLQSLPWQVPGPLPSVMLQQRLLQLRAVSEQVVRVATEGVWLHFDVCKLRGGHKLGSGVAHLMPRNCENGQLLFEAKQESVLVAMYDPASSSALTEVAGPAPEEVLPGTSSSSRASSNCCLNSSGRRDSTAAGCSPATLDAGDSCALIVAGNQYLLGKPTTNSEGLLVTSATDALRDLLSRDEAMVDFALFDYDGRLLLGRAGVELWWGEWTYTGIPADPQSVLGQMDEGAYETIVHEVFKLNFLVDGLSSSLWENHIVMDTMALSGGPTVPLISMDLSPAAVSALLMKPKISLMRCSAVSTAR